MSEHRGSSSGRATARKIWTLISFQLGWLACAFGAEAERAALGVFTVCILIAIHLALTPSASRRREALVLGTVGLAGGLIDTTLNGLAVFTFPGNMNPAFAPIFLSALYANFATTLRGPLAWLAPRPVVAALFGAVGGPLAYYAAARIGAIQLHNPALNLTVIGILWAIQTPIYLWLAGWFHRDHLLRLSEGN